jgi:hypothetical protein
LTERSVVTVAPAANRVRATAWIAAGADGRLPRLRSQALQVDLASGATLVLRDEVILGRHGERGGACRTRLRCDYDGRPLLRHDVIVDTGDDRDRCLSGRRLVLSACGCR